MKVTIKDCTEHPLDQIAEAAGTSTDRRDASFKRVRRCFEQGHGAVFEFADVTLFIEGISRACSHQLVRHRIASYCQKSQRYTTLEGADWYVTPPEISKSAELRARFDDMMLLSKSAYDATLNRGIKPEDARFLLPEATKTAITMKINARSLFNFMNLRTAQSAQWEIRDLANSIIEAVKGINEQWKQLIELWDDKGVTRREIVDDALAWFGVDESDPELVRDVTAYIESIYDRIKRGGR